MVAGGLDSLDKYIEEKRQKLLENLRFRETSTQEIFEIEKSVEDTYKIKLLHDLPDTWSYHG